MNKTLIKLVITLCAFWLVVGDLLAGTPNNKAMVKVIDGKSSSKSYLGFIINDAGYLLSSGPSKKGSSFVRLADGTEFSARFVEKDSVTGLVLLKIASQGKKLPFVMVAKSQLAAGRKVYAGSSLGRNISITAGSVGQIRDATNENESDLIIHNVVTDGSGIGSPLINNCGETVGVVVKKPGALGGLFAKFDKTVAYAVPVNWILSQFDSANIRISRSNVDCLSIEKQAEIDSKKAQEAEARADRLAAESEARAGRQAAEADARAAAIKRSADAKIRTSAANASRARKEAEAKATELAELEKKLKQTQDATSADKQELEDSIEDARIALDKAKDREAALALVKEQNEKRYFYWAAIAGVIVFIILIIFWVLRRRAITKVQSEKVKVEQKAASVQADLAVHQAQENRILSTPSLFIDGTSTEGNAIALRIPGSSIADSDGVTVGRSPSNSDFVINDPEVSRQHFKVFAQNGSLLIEDTGSTNGIILDGSKVEPGEAQVVNQGVKMTMGDLKLTLRIE